MITSGDGVPTVYKRPQRQRRTMVRHQCSQGRISHHWWDHHPRYCHHRCIIVHIMYTGISTIFATDHKESTCKTRRVGRLRLWKHWVQNSTTTPTSKTSGLTTWKKCRDITTKRHNRWSGTSRGCSSIRRQSTRCFTSTTSTGKHCLLGSPWRDGDRISNINYKQSSNIIVSRTLKRRWRWCWKQQGGHKMGLHLDHLQSCPRLSLPGVGKVFPFKVKRRGLVTFKQLVII